MGRGCCCWFVIIVCSRCCRFLATRKVVWISEIEDYIPLALALRSPPPSSVFLPPRAPISLLSPSPHTHPPQ